MFGVGGVERCDSNLFSKFNQVLNEENPSNIRYLIALFKKLRKFKFSEDSIIHAQRPDMLIPAIFFSRKIKLVCSLHGAHDKAVFDKKGYLYGLIYSFLQYIAFRYADLLIAVDIDTMNYYKNKFKFLANKIKHVPISVDIDKFSVMDRALVREKYNFCINDNIMIYVGRLEKEKNIQFLIESFNEVKKKLRNSKLVLVGNGRDKYKLEQFVKSFSIEGVKFIGEVSNEIIPELLNCANLFVFASHYEGSPTVIREALSCNIPVVSVDVGDVKEVISDLEGCFLSKRDKYDFAEKTLNILNQKNMINVRERALYYSNENISEITKKLFEDLYKN